MGILWDRDVDPGGEKSAPYLAELVEVVDKLAVVLVPAKHVFTVILFCLHPVNKGGKYRQLFFRPFAHLTLLNLCPLSQRQNHFLFTDKASKRLLFSMAGARGEKSPLKLNTLAASYLLCSGVSARVG